MLPGAGIDRLMPIRQLTEAEAKMKRLSMKSRGTLDKKELKIQAQMKDLMNEWKEIQQVKESQDIKDPTMDDDEWDTSRPV